MPAELLHFYDPHPGLAGCPRPLPEPVRIVANELAETETTLDDAMARISNAAKTLGRYRVENHDDFLALTRWSTEDEYPQDNWRVIRYHPVDVQ